MLRGQHNTDNVIRLFMLVCLCFGITSLLMIYDSYFNEAVVESDFGASGEDDLRSITLSEHEQGHSDDDDTIARELYRKVKVLCWIMTAPKNLKTKATAVKKTWAKRCNKYIFFSSQTNETFPTVGLNVSEGREHLTGKTVHAFRYCYEHYGNAFDWFLKADDDTYVIVENLRYFLSHHQPNDNIYFGFKFKVIVKQGYFSGGAGYVFSRKALNRFVNVGLRNPLLCRRDGGAEDAEIGKCMQRLGVKVGDSLDVYGKESFHPFPPISHILGEFPYWMYNNAYHKVKKGAECCSDYSVTFHYMSPNDMYLTDFLLYHLRPFGIHRKDHLDDRFPKSLLAVSPS